LQERRQELDTRQRELDMRESLLRATERRLEQRANELRELEGRIASLEQRRDEAEQTRFRGVVSMYESMRPKDAARIFDSLDMSVLLEVARAMRPPKLADIIAQMQPDPAKRLTTELARRPNQTASADPRQVSPDTLPKIEGRPTR
jgi:flagellar motility protein MotE (MotC chaperone)